MTLGHAVRDDRAGGPAAPRWLVPALPARPPAADRAGPARGDPGGGRDGGSAPAGSTTSSGPSGSRASAAARDPGSAPSSPPRSQPSSPGHSARPPSRTSGSTPRTSGSASRDARSRWRRLSWSGSRRTGSAGCWASSSPRATTGDRPGPASFEPYWPSRLVVRDKWPTTAPVMPRPAIRLLDTTGPTS